MRVLFLSTWFPHPVDNGSKIRVYHLLRLLGANHKVSLLSFAFGLAAPEGAEELRDFCAEIQVVRLNPFEVNQRSALGRFLSAQPVAFRPVPAMSHQVQSALASHDFDAIIASTEAMASYALMAPETTKVLEEHNSLTRMLWDRYQAEQAPLRRLQTVVSWQKARRYEASLFGHFDLVTMVSEQDRKISKETLPGFRGRIEIVPNGVDCTHNRPGLVQPSADTLVFSGSLTYTANSDAMRYFLAEIYPSVKEQAPGVRLSITGSTSGVDVSSLPLDDSVRFTGYVEDVRPLVAGAWVCVVPIRQGGGTRLKILEAMALGTPVVSTSKGAEGLEVNHGEDILMADEPAAFARQVVRLLHEPELRDHMAANARRLVEERYNWQAIGQRFVRLVEDAVAEKRAG